MAPSRGGLLLAALCACSLFSTASPRGQTDGTTASPWAGVLVQGRELRQAGGNSRTKGGCDAALDPCCRESLATMLLASGRFLQAGQPGAGRLDTLRGGGPTRAEMEEKMLAERCAQPVCPVTARFAWTSRIAASLTTQKYESRRRLHVPRVGYEARTTPESLKRLPKVNSLCTAAVFKRQYRPRRRPDNDPPLSAVWRGTRGLSAECVTEQGGSLGGGGEAQGQAGGCLRLLCYLTQRVFEVALHKSSPP